MLDRLLNNQALRRTALCEFFAILLSAGVSLLLSRVLVIGLFRAFADSDSVFSAFPQLHPAFSSAFWKLFAAMFGLSGGLLLVCQLSACHQISSIYSELDQLSADARRLCDDTNELHIPPRGNATGCIRKLSDSVQRIASRTHAAYQRIQAQNKLRTDLLVNLSHQIKTSLAVIRLNRDMLAELPLPDKERDRLSAEIELHLDGMETLILDTLTLARLRADRMQYAFTETDLAATCRLALDRIQPLCREKGISATVELAGETEPEGIALLHDRVWFCEAVQNLLKNAVDHAGCTELRVILTALPAAVKLQILDNGRGIPLSEIRGMFERFRTASQSTLRNSGVGMAIAKEIFSAHGGAVTVYSGDSGTELLTIFTGAG